MKQIRLSHSSQEVLNTCERLYQIESLLTGQRIEYGSADTAKGHAFGKGVQVYLLTGDMDKALFHAWLAYWPDAEHRPKVSLHRTLHALMCAQEKLNDLLAKYEVVSFRGRPAIELGIRLNIDAEYYWSGALDIVLRNKETGLYVAADVKYTGYWQDVEAMFFNSGQLIGYSVALDAIIGEKLSEYGVLYFICQDSNAKPQEIRFHIKEWEKSLKDRLRWFVTLGIDIDRIRKMRELNVFPQRGKSCIHFNKVCAHFGTCGLTMGDKEREEETDRYEYLFTYELDAVIKDHLERTV